METKVEEICQYLTEAKMERKEFFKFLAVFAGSLAFLGNAKLAYAHPPSDITITFDEAAKVLKAVITHPVNNPDKHFINKVEVGLNGQEIIEHKISRQDNDATQTVSYLIPDAKIGDGLSVEAYCSISGKLKKEIAVK